MNRSQPLRIFKLRGHSVISGYVAALTQAEVLACLRSWAYHLDDRGVIHLALAGTDAFVELRKRRWKTRPDLLLFRYRNADTTRHTFATVRKRFDDAGVGYEMTVTRKTRRPRALEVALDPYDPLSAQVALNLAVRAFGESSSTSLSYDLACSGHIREDAIDPPIALEYPDGARRQDKAYELGFRVGSVVGTVLRPRRTNG
jgi:hypothetical protein